MNNHLNEEKILGGCCGRPMHYDATPKCNYNSCCMNEYAYKQKACIRNKQPDCEAQAVIPSITVETVDGITNLANCLVHVTSTNTTYYVDDKHRIMITWAGPVNIPGYDMEGNPEGFKDQIVTDTEAGIAVIYDKNGIGYTFGIQEGLDLQEEVNNKLDEMAESGQLGDIIGVYLQTTALWTFDNVADMKQSSNLVNNSFAKTLGFYTPNDGGMATYKVRTKTESDTPNEMNLIAIGDTLVAELILNDVANIKQLGAKGDNTTDTASAFNLAVSTGLPIIIPKGEYKLDSKVVIAGDQNIYGEDSKINYTGEDYAFSINTTLKKIVKFGTITAVDGGCLEFYATTTASNDFSQYVDVYFKEFKCKTNGIYAEETGEGSWVNEIRLFNGRLSSYQENSAYVGTGLKLVHNYNGADKINGWRCYNLGFEGLNKGVHLISTAGRMNKIMFVGCRYSEAYGTLVTTEGNVSSVLWVGTDSIRFDRFNLSNTTSTFKVIAPCSDPDTGQYFGYGAEYNFGTWSCNNHTKLPEDADLNNYQIEGVYSCFSNTVRTTLLNIPDEILNTADDYFTLHVTQTQTSNLNSERRCTQLIISRNGTFSRISYANNQWTAWRKDSFIQCNTVLQNASADVFGANVLGKFVMFRIDVLKFTQTPPATSTNLLPESVRPKAKYFIPLWNSTTSAYDARCIIETDGHVKFINCTTTGQYYGSMMYFAG